MVDWNNNNNNNNNVLKGFTVFTTFYRLWKKYEFVYCLRVLNIKFSLRFIFTIIIWTFHVDPFVMQAIPNFHANIFVESTVSSDRWRKLDSCFVNERTLSGTKCVGCHNDKSKTYWIDARHRFRTHTFFRRK